MENQPEETRYALIIIVSLIGAVIVLLGLNLFFRMTENPVSSTPKEKTVIVSDAEKNAVLAKTRKNVVESVQELAKKDDDEAPLQLQLNRVTPGSKEYEEIKHQIDSAKKLKDRTDVKKVKNSPNGPLRYLDKSSPQDRSVPGAYLYLIDMGAGIWPRICIQTAGKEQLRLNGFKITADGKQFLFQPVPFKREKAGSQFAEYYDAPMSLKGYNAFQAMAKAKKSTITYLGADGETRRDVTKEEKVAFERMMDTYLALGGIPYTDLSGGK